MIRATPIFLVCTVIFASSWSQSLEAIIQFANMYLIKNCSCNSGRHEQCRAVSEEFQGACRGRQGISGKRYQTRCDKLVCAIERTKQKEGRPKYRPMLSVVPANGTHCGRGKVCRNGQCLRSHNETLEEYKKLVAENVYCAKRRLDATSSASYNKISYDRK